MQNIETCVYMHFFLFTYFPLQEQDNILEFEECQPRSCVNILIVDDILVEYDEEVLVGLEEVNANITLDPAEGRIVIIDDDGGKDMCEAICIFLLNNYDSGSSGLVSYLLQR